MTLFGQEVTWWFLHFKSLEDQADFNSTLAVVTLALVVLKTVIDVLILRLVVRQANDVRVVMKIATQHQTGTTRQIEDTDRKVSELHAALVRVSSETKGKIDEVKQAAVGAACRLEQKIEEKAEEVKKANGGGH